MSIESKRLNILYSEYKECSKRIEDYQKKHFEYLKIVLLILGGMFTLAGNLAGGLTDSAIVSWIFEIKRYTPYLLFFVGFFILYHYKRTLATQGYRRALEEKINNILAGEDIDKTKYLLFSEISHKRIITTKNPLIVIIPWAMIIVLIGLIASLNDVSFDWNNYKLNNFFSFHVIVQYIVMIVIFIFYKNDTKHSSDKTYNEASRLLGLD